MESSSILKRIVEEQGNCSWATKATCEKCPLSKLKQRENGNYMSCIEALQIENISEEEADAKYQEVAERLLLDESIESILGEEDDGTI